MRSWDRLLRRSGLPVHVSAGFHPRVVISAPLALALGVEAWDELIEFELKQSFTAEEIQRRIESHLVSGLSWSV